MKKTEKQKAREWLVNAGETEAVRLVKPSVCLSITFHRDQATLTFLTNNLLSLGLSSALTQQYLVLLSLKLLWRIYFTKDPYYLMSKGRCSMLQKIKKFSTPPLLYYFKKLPLLFKLENGNWWAEWHKMRILRSANFLFSLTLGL